MIWGPIIAAGIGVVGNWLTAKKTADTAKQAAQTINQGVRSAEGQITSAYNTAQSAISPFVQSGTAAQNTLAQLMGLGAVNAGGGTTASTPINTPTAPPSTLDDMTREERQIARQAARQRSVRDETAAGDAVLGPPMSGRYAPQPPANASSYAPTQPQGASGTSYVQMQAPDGSQQAVPSQYVDHFAARGATVIR